MRIRQALCWSLSAMVGLQAADFRLALPGYRYEFPRDHFSHETFQTEWWYYTGNLRGTDGHRFGFELTFFRHAVRKPASDAKSSPWDVDDVYVAHFALSDLDGKRFVHTERVNRGGPGLAGINPAAGRVWNGNWQVRLGNGQDLEAIDPRFSVSLHFDTQKPPVIHGVDGVSQKGAGVGRASHYVSFTRLLAKRGTVVLDGKSYTVADGTAWMDHEFFTHRLDEQQTGWDWFALQLDDGADLMVERIRRRDGSPDPFASGTYVDAQGKSTHLTARDFALEPFSETWASPVTKAVYPIHWRVRVPSLGLDLDVSTPLVSQELASPKQLTSRYWEGAVVVTGSRTGRGYLELTGYDKPVDLGR